MKHLSPVQSWKSVLLSKLLEVVFYWSFKIGGMISNDAMDESNLINFCRIPKYQVLVTDTSNIRYAVFINCSWP